MKPINYRIRFGIIGKISFDPNIPQFKFKVPIKDNNQVDVELLPTDNDVLSTHIRNVSESLYKFLQKNNNDIPSDLEDELFSIPRDVSTATKKVLNLIKYTLHEIDLNETLLSHKIEEWSENDINWNHWPIRMSVTVDDFGIHLLNTKTVSSIQQLIDNDFEPFIALRHLHKARIERISHYKWIDATIAAELAIKEFLVRVKPEIATLLLEMPSPPLQKLYGSVLESFGFQKSPYVSQISKGVEIRNALIHRPGEIKITDQQAIKYVKDVENAIFHLMFLRIQ
jgi:hypothetical protein